MEEQLEDYSTQNGKVTIHAYLSKSRVKRNSEKINSEIVNVVIKNGRSPTLGENKYKSIGLLFEVTEPCGKTKHETALWGVLIRRA